LGLGSQVITADPLSPYADPELYVSLNQQRRVCRNRGEPEGASLVDLLSVARRRQDDAAQGAAGAAIDSRHAFCAACPPRAVSGWLLHLVFGESVSNDGEAKRVLGSCASSVTSRSCRHRQVHRAPIGSVRTLAALAY
jgi:hypothetical protein